MHFAFGTKARTARQRRVQTFIIKNVLAITALFAVSVPAQAQSLSADFPIPSPTTQIDGLIYAPQERRLVLPDDLFVNAPADQKENFKKADQLWNDGKHLEAVSLIEQAMATNPSGHYLFYLSSVYFHGSDSIQKDKEKSTTFLEQATRYSPDYYIVLANRYLAADYGVQDMQRGVDYVRRGAQSGCADCAHYLFLRSPTVITEKMASDSVGVIDATPEQALAYGLLAYDLSSEKDRAKKFNLLPRAFNALKNDDSPIGQFANRLASTNAISSARFRQTIAKEYESGFISHETDAYFKLGPNADPVTLGEASLDVGAGHCIGAMRMLAQASVTAKHQDLYNYAVEHGYDCGDPLFALEAARIFRSKHNVMLDHSSGKWERRDAPERPKSYDAALQFARDNGWSPQDITRGRAIAIGIQGVTCTVEPFFLLETRYASRISYDTTVKRGTKDVRMTSWLNECYNIMQTAVNLGNNDPNLLAIKDETRRLLGVANDKLNAMVQDRERDQQIYKDFVSAYNWGQGSLTVSRNNGDPIIGTYYTRGPRGEAVEQQYDFCKYADFRHCPK